VRVEDEIAAIRGDEQDPLSRGRICVKALAQDLHEDRPAAIDPAHEKRMGAHRVAGG
jgi:hypothetical protein